MGRAGASGGGFVETGQPGGGSSSSKPPPGRRTEDALQAVLERAGWRVITYPAWLRATVRERAILLNAVVREFPVGLLCDPPRGFRADFYFTGPSVEVSVEGNAHACGDARRGRDVERRQAIEAAGVRIVSVLPRQVTRDNGAAAMRVIRAALGVELPAASAGEEE